jgi:hypothetical protein
MQSVNVGKYAFQFVGVYSILLLINVYFYVSGHETNFDAMLMITLVLSYIIVLLSSIHPLISGGTRTSVINSALTLMALLAMAALKNEGRIAFVVGSVICGIGLLNSVRDFWLSKSELR